MDLQKPGTVGSSLPKLAALVIHADESFSSHLKTSLTQDDIDTEAVQTEREAFTCLTARTFDAVIVDESHTCVNGPLWESLALRLPANTALYLVSTRSQPQVMSQFHTRIKAVFQTPFETEVLISDIRSYIRERKLYGAKRKWDRIPLLVPTEFRTEDGALLADAMLVNLSVGGFFAAFPRNTKLPERGSHITYSIHIPGQEPLSGSCTVQWRQSEEGIGCGCELRAPSAEVLERICHILNGVRTRKIEKKLRAQVRISDLTTHAARLQGWLEPYRLVLTDYACVCEAEIDCFAPVLLANLSGVIRAFGTTCCRPGATISLDVTTTPLAVIFNLSCNDTSLSLGTSISLETLMPQLQLAAGGREMLSMHNATVDFALQGEGPTVSLKVPIHQRW